MLQSGLFIIWKSQQPQIFNRLSMSISGLFFQGTTYFLKCRSNWFPMARHHCSKSKASRIAVIKSWSYRWNRRKKTWRIAFTQKWWDTTDTINPNVPTYLRSIIYIIQINPLASLHKPSDIRSIHDVGVNQLSIQICSGAGADWVAALKQHTSITSHQSASGGAGLFT